MVTPQPAPLSFYSHDFEVIVFDAIRASDEFGHVYLPITPLFPPSAARRLHNPAGAASSISVSVKTPNEVEQSLHAYARVENPDHVLDAHPCLLPCAGKLLDGLR